MPIYKEYNTNRQSGQLNILLLSLLLALTGFVSFRAGADETPVMTEAVTETGQDAAAETQAPEDSASENSAEEPGTETEAETEADGETVAEAETVAEDGTETETGTMADDGTETETGTVAEDGTAEETGAETERLTVQQRDPWLRYRQLVAVHLRTPLKETAEEEKIFSYVQVPRSVCPDPRWTGYWANLTVNGRLFSTFGCGICCLSNIYSTLTEQRTSPYTMLQWCRKYSSYYPSAQSGAIDWKAICQMCDWFGFDSEALRKPQEYSTFQKHIMEAEAAMVLVSKNNNDKLWWYTEGHYVTVWQYDPSDDTVFVADSSGLWNRQRVALADVYAALKTSSSAQYLLVHSTEK